MIHCKMAGGLLPPPRATFFGVRAAHLAAFSSNPSLWLLSLHPNTALSSVTISILSAFQMRPCMASCHAFCPHPPFFPKLSKPFFLPSLSPNHKFPNQKSFPLRSSSSLFLFFFFPANSHLLIKLFSSLPLRFPPKLSQPFFSPLFLHK